MSFYDPQTPHQGFEVDLQPTTDLIQRFHRTLMDRRHELEWSFDASAYTPEAIEEARRQWSYRAVAEYESTAQFAQLLHRLTLLGAPLELIGAATRLATDECRHAELCARYANLLGGADTKVTHDGMSLYDDVDDLAVQCALTVLADCCFGETLSVPMFNALAVVTTDPLGSRVVQIIAGDEEYHSRFGWEALGWFLDHMDEAQVAQIRGRLPGMMQHFEGVCFGGPDVLEKLLDTEIEIEAGPPNLGTLAEEAYATIFYATIEQTILPGLNALGFDADAAWQTRG